MVLIVAATYPEVKPLIKKLNLSRESKHFPLFSGDSIKVIVSGIGGINSAAAVGYISALTGNNNAILNLGISGHSSLEVGTLYLANKISHKFLPLKFYPFIPFKTKLPETCIVTTEQPEKIYPSPNTGYDMESYYFFSAAYRLFSLELIYVAKVVSDNTQNTIDNLNTATVTKLMEKKLDSILELLEDIKKIETEKNKLRIQLSATSKKIIEQLSLTFTERKILEKRLLNIENLGGTKLLAKILKISQKEEILAKLKELEKNLFETTKL